MPRAITSGERALLAASTYGLHLRVEAANASGTMIDLSSWVAAVDINASQENGAKTCTLTLARESGQGGTQSLAPFLSSSTLNRNNSNAYAPLLNPNRAVRISTAVTVSGVAPLSVDWKVVFIGITDSVDWGASPLTVQLRDGVKALLDTQIETERVYGADTPGVAVETVMQQIIDDNVPNPPPLINAVAPNWFLSEFTQETVRVYDALRALALQIGWDVRMRWSGNTEFLSFFKPDRTKGGADFTLGASEYVRIPSLAIGDDGIRNVIEVVYTDATTGLTSTATVTDPSSVAAYGRRFMRIGEAATSNIDTAVEAQAMANAALADLSNPVASQDVEATYFWPIELGDVIAFAANGVHYDAAQTLAVFAYTHHLEHGSGRTTLRTSGKPSGAYATWRALEGDVGTGGLSAAPELLYVAAPIPVFAAGVIVGWKLSGRVDDDTNALIATLSSSLAMRTSSPAFVTVSNPPATEYWLPVVPGGAFTVEVALTQGGYGQVTLVPASLYNPTDTIPPPRGGTLGGAFVQSLSRTPITSINTQQPTATLFAVTLTVRPATATLKYRYKLGGLTGAEPWTSIVNAVGSTTFSVDVSGGFVMLEYYGVSVDGVSEEIHSIRLDAGSIPIVTLTATESAENVATLTIGINDDVVAWSLYAKRGNAAPLLPNGTPDPAFLRATGNRQRTQVDMYVAGANVTPDDIWTFYAYGTDKDGIASAPGIATLTVRGAAGSPTVGALSNLAAVVVNESGTNYIDLTWTNNAIIEAAAASRFGVVIYENGVQVQTQQAKVDHLGTDTMPGVGGWHRPCTPSTAGAPNANFLTFSYGINLFDNGGLVGNIGCEISGWFLGTGFGAPPTATPPVPVVSVVTPGSHHAVWSGVGLTTDALEIEWHYSSDNFAADDHVFMSEVLAAMTTTHDAGGLLPPRYARCRLRYAGTYGNGPWSAYSNSVQAQHSVLP